MGIVTIEFEEKEFVGFLDEKFSGERRKMAVLFWVGLLLAGVVFLYGEWFWAFPALIAAWIFGLNGALLKAEQEIVGFLKAHERGRIKPSGLLAGKAK